MEWSRRLTGVLWPAAIDKRDNTSTQGKSSGTTAGCCSGEERGLSFGLALRNIHWRQVNLRERRGMWIWDIWWIYGKW